ncbi:hypothetical protein SLS58_009847 [Diplodia intermedia]|uniref:Uncharacterized protein n=1 Tax=Diplodia intermedia TaxID=856260 RepID=A0ABR3TAE8_9PEZI
MPPKRQTDATYYSPRGNTSNNRQEDLSFDEALFQNAWLGYWDDQWSFSENAPFARRFDEDMPSYVTLTDTRPAHVKTFEVVAGQVPHDKEGFPKEKNKKTPHSQLGRIKLVAIPFKGDLWCWAYRFWRVIRGRREELFAVLGLETNRWQLGGIYHEKYSYLLRDENMGQRGYSRDFFAYVSTGKPSPHGRTSGVHAQSPPEQTSNGVETPHAGHDSSLGDMDEDMPGVESTTDTGTASLSHACNVPREADVSRGRSETLRPDARREDPSPTDPLVPSIESPHSQEENRATAETLLDQFRPRTNCSMRPINGEPFSQFEWTGKSLPQKQKRRREYEDDSSDDARRMPPPPPPKSARMTGPGNCSINGPPNGDPSGEVSPTYQSMIQERRGSYSAQPSPSPTSTGRPRTLARKTYSTPGTPGINNNNNNKAAQDRHSASPSKEPSPDHLPDQRRDSPLQQRSPSEATAFHQSEEQLWGESSAAGAASATSFTAPTSTREDPLPLAIRTSPAMTPATTPGASPVMSGGFRFDVNRVLFKLVMLEGPNSNREYAMRLHGCHTAQALFQAVEERLDDALGPGEVVRRLVCHTNTFVPSRCRGAIDLPRGKHSEASFDDLLSRLKATVNGAKSDDDIEVVAEVVEVTRRS